MKISKQERIIIICFIVAAILGVGFFMFVLPNINNIGVNQKQLDAKKAEYQQLEDKLNAREPVIEDEIKKAYEEGKNLADTFYDDLTAVEGDEITRQFVALGKDIKIDGLSIASYSTEALSVDTYSKTNVSYPLKDFANTVVIDDNSIDYSKLSTREKILAAKHKMAVDLKNSGAVSVGCMNVTFVAHSDKLENLHAFADLLNAGVYDESIKGADGKPQRKATFIDGVVFELENQNDDDKDNNSGSGEQQEGESQQSNGNDKDKKDFSMTFSVKYYCIKPVADPFANKN